MKRRGTGEGALFQLPDGKWRGAVELGWLDGKRVRKYTSRFATAGEAKAAILKMRTTSAAGLPQADDRITVGKFLVEWLAGAKLSTRATTWASYDSTVKLHLEPVLGKVRLAKLTPRQVEALMEARLSAGASPTTARYSRNVLRAALSVAVRRGYIARNVAALAVPPRLTRREIQPPTPQEARALIEATADTALGTVWVVALSTGLRRGELAGLKWADIDMKTGELSVRRQVVSVTGKSEVVEPKTESGRRVVVLAAGALAALKAHDRREQLLRGGRKRSEDWVFANRAGGHLDPAALSRAFAAAVKAAGLRPMRLHDTRHGTASYLISKGASARLVQGVLGHSSATTTLSVYSHLFAESRQEAADTIGDVLFPEAIAR